jgi:hypothetical protein
MLVLYVDPSAARRRQDAAQKEARVELWHEQAGTCALAGRDLPPAYTIAADKYLAAELSQSASGELTVTTPAGRGYTTSPPRYPL